MSWHAGAITGVPVKDEFDAIPGSKVPSVLPASTIGAGRSDRRPNFSIRLVAQVRRTGSTSWVVVALVNSQTAFPVSQKLKRSGIVTSYLAAAIMFGVSAGRFSSSSLLANVQNRLFGCRVEAAMFRCAVVALYFHWMASEAGEPEGTPMS